MSSLVTCETFATDENYVRLRAGHYTLSYTDMTHLPADEWVDVFEIEINEAPGQGFFADAEKSFVGRHRLDNIQDPRRVALLRDVLGLSLARVGLVQPELPGDLFRQVSALHDQDGIVLIPDSNSLYNGSLHWLLQVLRESTVWILPFVVSLTQIQERDARLKDMVKKGPDNNRGSQALRLRATINSSLSLLQRHKSRYQVLELDPSLLRYLKLAPADSEGNVLEDRLLIEGVHAVLRATRTRATQVVVTSDVLLARVLEAEGIDHLFLPRPQLPNDRFGNLRFDALSRRFAGAPLRVLMWDLAHALSTVRLTSGDGRGFTLATYWPGKTPEDWRLERLSCASIGSGDARSAPTRSPHAKAASPSAAAPARRAAKGPRPVRTRPASTSGEPSDAFLPRASLAQALRVGAAVRAVKQGDLARIVTAVDENDRPTPEIARRALQILTRIGAVLHEGTEYLATSVLDEMDEALATGQLDSLHRILLRFPPYALVSRTLAEQGSIDREALEPLLRSATDGPINTDAASRLPRFHTLLGQAWTEDNTYFAGAARPGLDEFEMGFRRGFDETQRDGFASVQSLLPAVGHTLSMSPWAIDQYLGRLFDEGRLREFTFQPAAGKKPVYRDKVLSGSLAEVTEQPVPIDRIIIGGRPIFTIGRGPE